MNNSINYDGWTIEVSIDTYSVNGKSFDTEADAKNYINSL